MDACKCIVPLRHQGTLNPLRAASPLVRLEGEERWVASEAPQGVLPLNWGGAELNRTVTCMVLKATANDRRTSSPFNDEFHGLRSDTVVISYTRAFGDGPPNFEPWSIDEDKT
ncbi:uncharacterized protein TNCV_1479011 [Trichonephila clavipes]|nr:uncharacterized protein TNCV_1479011 [Trichonephila clavipes]